MLPHDKVFTRLGISNIDGIGVFAIKDIPEKTLLFEYDNTAMVWVDADQITDIPQKLRKMYDDFCVVKNDKRTYGCPSNFNQLTMSWYMNHSDTPNVEADNDYNFFTKRAIHEGEELTINYHLFSEFNL